MLGFRQCLGLDGTLAVPACRLQPRALGGLRLRRKMRLDATRVSSWVDQADGAQKKGSSAVFRLFWPSKPAQSTLLALFGTSPCHLLFLGRDAGPAF